MVANLVRVESCFATRPQSGPSIWSGSCTHAGLQLVTSTILNDLPATINEPAPSKILPPSSWIAAACLCTWLVEMSMFQKHVSKIGCSVLNRQRNIVFCNALLEHLVKKINGNYLISNDLLVAFL